MTEVLVLGGTAEARELAGALSRAGADVVSSLAGRTSVPPTLPGRVRVGGFGGVAGLRTFLAEEEVSCVVDATHPFAARMSLNAVAACDGVPLLRLVRPGFVEGAGDRWTWVPTLTSAASAVDRLGTRALITTGRQELGPFAELRAWALLRSIEPPAPPLPARHEVLLARGPFTVSSELELLRRSSVDVVVTKDSGGSDAKLVAARELGLPVVLVERPPVDAPHHVGTVAEAFDWAMVQW